MAAPVQTFDLIQDALKEDYAPRMENQVCVKSPLYNVIKKKVADFYGKRYVIPVMLSMPEGVGSRAAGDYSLPTAGKTSYDQAYIDMKRVYGRCSIDGLSIASSKGKGGWVELFTQEIKNITNTYALELDRQLMLDGSGKLAQVNGAPVGQVITVDNPGGITGDLPTTKWFRVGQRLNFYTAGGVQHNTVAVVSAVAAATITVTGTIAAVADDDWIYMENTYHATADSLGVLMGIDGIVAAGNAPGATFQGIDATAAGKENWRATVSAAVGVVDEVKIQQILDTIENSTDEFKPNFALTTPLIYNKLWSIQSALRHNVNTIDFKLGHKAMEFVSGGLDLTFTKHPRCPVGYLYLLNLDHLKLYVLKPMAWDDKGGGIIKPIADYDAYEAWFGFYGQLGTDMRNTHGKGTGVLVA